MNVNDFCLNMVLNFRKWEIKSYDLENYMKGNIYHYTNVYSLENIIKSKKLWITKSNFLNDKTEYIYAFNLVNEVYKRSNYKSLYQNTFNIIMRDVKSNFNRSFVFSSS